jgi:hypothetical protein
MGSGRTVAVGALPRLSMTNASRSCVVRGVQQVLYLRAEPRELVVHRTVGGAIGGMRGVQLPVPGRCGREGLVGEVGVNPDFPNQVQVR